ncbi:DUF417 family protein [Pseudoalteromonas denitrificans]|uniref:Uncharacterized membrane protein YkgB n=1 Tax=Pseudoalteromonas denitrificans DSM 6059 TaxID=1123010 RepID=A0A1I1UUB4_9GAMM|nr:DUF417 family protein [Pseudoalteromonas denitrificans]SFD74165.1 Uncharacterized membrane protein YkgB [Pseudoalteromonas denitrificans DSM 6059]
MKNILLHQKAIFTLLLTSFILMGLSTYLIGEHKSISFTLNFYGVSGLFSNTVFVLFATIAFLLCAALSFGGLNKQKVAKGFGYLLVFISLVPLFTLFSEKVWISSLGGFPAIGSGQGIIKYFALFSIGCYFIKPEFLSNRQLIWLNFFPVALVYIWIGGMKFTLVEAQGIEALVKSSFLMSWLYNFFDVQMTSNLIGFYDLVITLVLAISMYTKRYLIIALLLASTVFIVTQSFLFTFSGSLSVNTLLTGTGQFIIKDLWFIVNLVVIHQLTIQFQDVK